MPDTGRCNSQTGFTIIDSQTVSALGKSAVGVISALTYTDTVDNPQSKEFAANFRAKYNADSSSQRIIE
jgi:hypothetical protein